MSYINEEYFIERLTKASAIERLELLKELIENSESNHFLEYLLSNKYINASEKMNYEGDIIPLYYRVLQKNNVVGAFILAKYGANLDETIHFQKDYKFGSSSITLQHYTMECMRTSFRYMHKDAFVLQELLVNALRNGNATATVVDSNGKTPISYLFSNMEFPEYSPNNEFVRLIIELVSTYIHYGMSINYTDKMGKDCLYYMLTKFYSSKDAPDLLEYLFSIGANIDNSIIKDKFSDIFFFLFPLDRFGPEKTSLVLINNGLDVSEVNPDSMVNPNIKNAILAQKSQK